MRGKVAKELRKIAKKLDKSEVRNKQLEKELKKVYYDYSRNRHRD